MAAKAVTQSIDVSTASQVISFDPAATLLMTDSPYPLTATASSLLPVSLVAGPSEVCLLEGSALMLRGSGSCSVTASQPGDWRYEPAEAVTRQIAVSLASQEIAVRPAGVGGDDRLASGVDGVRVQRSAGDAGGLPEWGVPSGGQCADAARQRVVRGDCVAGG